MSRLIIFYFVLHTSLCAAQDGFQQGYILLNSGDTLYGLVKDRKTGFDPKRLQKVRLKHQGKVKRLSIKQIQEYRIGENTFERYSLLKTRSFPKEEYTSVKENGDFIFLRVIVKGNLNYLILEQYDEESKTYDEIELVQLDGEERIIRATQGILGLKKKLLSDYLSEYPEFVQRINQNEFKRIKELVEAFNASK